MRDRHVDLELLEIRPASAEDAKPIAELHGRSFLATYPELPRTVAVTLGGSNERTAYWTNRLRGLGLGCAVFVARDRAALRGFVYAGPTADPDDGARRTGQVYSIHVDPWAQGAGIGSELLDAAVSFLRASGFDDVTLWVVDSNLGARKFYEARGFGLDGARRREILALGSADGDVVDVVRYRRQLTAGEHR